MVKIINITDMPTEIRETLVLVDDKGEEQLHFFLNTKEEITITDDISQDNPYAFYGSINKEDWQDIKKFIDEFFD